MGAGDIPKIAKAMRFYLGNPLSRMMVRAISKRCKVCGDVRIDLAVRKYAGEELRLCFKCTSAYRLLSVILGFAGRKFGVSEGKMKEFFGDSVFRRVLVNVIRSTGEYGITVPQKLAAPFLVVWGITNSCNLACKHCYADAGIKKRDELSTEDALNLIDQLADFGIAALAFSGGEPLLRRDVYKLISYASSKKLYTALATNGTLVRPRVAKKLKQAGLQYAEVSIDGCKVTHDIFRGFEGVFERSVEGLKALKKEGIYTCIATTVSNYNISEVDDIILLAKELGVDRFIHFNFIPSRRGKSMESEDINQMEREKLLRHLYKQNKENGMEIFSTAPQYARVALQMEAEPFLSYAFYGGKANGNLKEIADFISGCGGGRLYCGIEANGDVVPCVFMPIRAGNVKERSFSEIWQTSKIMEKLRTREGLEGVCGRCKYKYACSGCRSRAYAYFGRVNAPDPGCIYYRGEKLGVN